MKKKICILYTGGTIGMVPTEKGFAPKKGYFHDAIAAIPDIHEPDMPDWDMIEFDPLLDSSNIALDQWNMIGRAIRYFLIVIMAGIVWPLSFKCFSKLGRK
jgi:L-asparaginase